MMNWKKYNPPEEVRNILTGHKDITIASTIDELVDLACGGRNNDYFEVAYEVPGYGKMVETEVVRVRNGVCANYTTPYMRRRDPDALVVGDDQPTNKVTFQERFGTDFSDTREKTLQWLKGHPVTIYGFTAGKPGMGTDALCIAPSNAGFFALGLALLQGIIEYKDIPADFNPKAIIYVAPTFRYRNFGGKQVVVHNRRDDIYEVFSYNLYPGPSAKKGVYGVLIDLGEKESWVTAHCSVVQVITPYDNIVTIMHEGASGAGKSEMLEQAHRERDGRLLIGENVVTGEHRHLAIPRSCELNPVVDDMALCHPSIQTVPGKLTVADAEDSWFVRTNHIDQYGTDVNMERLTAQATSPCLFLNINAAPGSRALIWEHTEDAPGKPCPNPRATIPRHMIPNIVEGPVTVDIRSFGIRTPPCTKDNPTYGIVGIFHILPPALAWLWRLVAPRGHDNPSIVDSKGLSSEGVGSYWPFAPGRRVPQANLLLNQFHDNGKTSYILTPNQYVGSWKVGFMPQWITREYLARRGYARFKPDQIRESRCHLLGAIPHQVQVEGSMVSRWFFQVETQPEVGEEAYDIGANILQDFFKKTLSEYMEDDLDPLGRKIIECCFDDGDIHDYENLIPAS